MHKIFPLNYLLFLLTILKFVNVIINTYIILLFSSIKVLVQMICTFMPSCWKVWQDGTETEKWQQLRKQIRPPHMTSAVNKLSENVLGKKLFANFRGPNKYTGNCKYSIHFFNVRFPKNIHIQNKLLEIRRGREC